MSDKNNNKKTFTCCICNNEYKSENRLKNHFKICNYSNLEKKITKIDFELFSLLGENNNLKKQIIILETQINNFINEVCD